jgi:hypothetical protein
VTVSLKHSKTSVVGDSGDSALVQPSDWNAQHELTQSTDRMLGRVASGVGDTEELTAAQVRGFTGSPDSSNDTVSDIIKLTQAEYDALGTPDTTTLYIISG